MRSLHDSTPPNAPSPYLPTKGGIAFAEPSVARGRLVERVNRFVAEVALEDGRTVPAHCPNSGRLPQAKTPGSPVVLTRAASPNRRLAWTWELTGTDAGWIAVNTALANPAVERALVDGVLQGGPAFAELRREVPFGDSRFDFLLTADHGAKRWIEVKSVSLKDDAGRYAFPDAPTERGRKHLAGLVDLVRRGDEAELWFFCMRTDGVGFAPARATDPKYDDALRAAAEAGVVVRLLTTRVDPTGLVSDGGFFRWNADGSLSPSRNPRF